jgi:hypothetical protein
MRGVKKRVPWLGQTLFENPGSDSVDEARVGLRKDASRALRREFPVFLAGPFDRNQGSKRQPNQIVAGIQFHVDEGEAGIAKRSDGE